MTNTNFSIKSNAYSSLDQNAVSGGVSILFLLLSQLKNKKANDNNYETRTLINEANVSLDTIKEEQKAHKKALEALAQQINQTKDKKEHEFLFKKLREKKEQLEKEEKAVTKITHAVNNGDFQTAANEAGVFGQNGTIVSNTAPSTVVNTNWMYPTPAKIELSPLQSLGGDTGQIKRYISPQPLTIQGEAKQPVQNINLPVFKFNSAPITDDTIKQASKIPDVNKQTEAEKHKLAQEIKELCSTTDTMLETLKDEDTNSLIGQKVNGYTIVHAKKNSRSNFKGISFQKNGIVVNCFVGTDPSNWKDHKANVQMGVGITTEQMKLAKEYTDSIRSNFGSNNRIINAGHSEGGSEATYSGLWFGLEVFTYNAFSLTNKHLKEIQTEKGSQDYNKLVSNYRDPHDPISKLFNSDIGKTYIVENQQTKFMANTPFGIKEAHGIKKMGNCQTAVAIAQYKAENPWFIDKIGNIKLTQKDINEIYKSGMEDIYFDEIYRQMGIKNNQTFSPKNYLEQELMQYFDSHYKYLTD